MRKSHDENAFALAQAAKDAELMEFATTGRTDLTDAVKRQAQLIYQTDKAYASASHAWLASYGELPTAPSNRFSVVAYNDYIQSTSTAGGDFSYPVFDGLLGTFDQMAIQVSADHVTLTPISDLVLTVWVSHSADGRNWILKGAAPAVTGTLDPIGVTALEPGFDDGSIPSLGYVRLVIVIDSSAMPGFSAHVKVQVTCNDYQEKAFTGLVEQERKQYETEFDPIERARRNALAGKAPRHEF